MMTDRFRAINWFKRPAPITNTKPFGKYLRSSRTDRAHRETVLQPKVFATMDPASHDITGPDIGTWPRIRGRWKRHEPPGRRSSARAMRVGAAARRSRRVATKSGF